MDIKSVIPQNGGYKMHTFQDVEDVYFIYISDPSDRAIIVKAYEFALHKHEGQYRKSGEPYIHHLIEVAYILAGLQGGPATLCAALLHDVIEDTDTQIDEIRSTFGDDVAMIVDSLTKIQRLKLSHRSVEDFEAEDHRKIFLGMAKDIRVILIKLADRLHNMRTLDSLSHDRQIALSNETLEVFAPIAHRLGIFKIKSELEDLSLKYLEPDIYNEIVSMINQRFKNRAKSLDSLKKKIADIMFENHLPFEIESRVKSIYSIYKKIYKKGRHFDEIYDLLALRIITKTELNCYEILGLIHAVYKPLLGRFKDYIAMPKANMYQSLHTTIISGDGNIYEIQIRTKEMDEIAETGVAAHWRYKEGTNYNPREEQKQIEEQLHWFRDFVTMSQDDIDSDAKTYMDNLSKDIFEANVYVFTPKGKVVDLPNGATPLDFAYKIHTKVGDSAVGAIVNGSMVPLNTALKTGDVVEIRTSSTSPGPNEGWLKIAKTNSALSHIRKAIAKKNADLLKDERIARGKQSLVDAFRDRGLDEQEMMSYIQTDKVLKNYSVSNVNDLFVLVASKNLTPGAIIDFLKIKKKVALTLSKQKASNRCPVNIQNIGNLAVSLGACCTPIPGDNIVGYITRGKGVTIHRVNCPNITHEKNRLIHVEWRDDISDDNYPVDIAIESSDRPNLLVDVMSSLSATKVSISAISAKFHPQTITTTINATILVPNSRVLNDTFNILLNVSGVYSVTRVIH